MQNQSAHRLLDSPFAPPARACGPVAASPANARRGLARLISERAELDFPSPRIVSLGLRPRAIGGRGKVDHENHPGAHAHSPTMLRVRKEAYHGLRLSVGAEASPRVLDKPVYEKSLDESRTKPLTSEPLCTAHRESGTVEPALAKRAKETECQSARVPESQKSQSAKVPNHRSHRSHRSLCSSLALSLPPPPPLAQPSPHQTTPNHTTPRLLSPAAQAQKVQPQASADPARLDCHAATLPHRLVGITRRRHAFGTPRHSMPQRPRPQPVPVAPYKSVQYNPLSSAFPMHGNAAPLQKPGLVSRVYVTAPA
ncbi:hypothetical protein AOQ84DRAFT_439565 [Glonium stellatum]|uniref:Uncharacterized protein n=1 Tax=Glonium stellatum TaxID=574774 RepID=A0A8E2F1J6_9PEZI|nr:hypothetical protein AOQ84DRAFT_439565 [Glonium stellatum]